MGSGGQHVRRLKKEGNPKKCARPRSLPDESAFSCASVSRGGASWGLLTTNVPHKRKKVRISRPHSLPICICHSQELVIIPFATPTLWKQPTTQLSSLIVQWEMRFCCVAKKPISLPSYVAKIENIEAADSRRRNRSSNNNVKFQNRLHSLITILHYCDLGD